MNSEFIHNITKLYGAEGKNWIDSIPEILAKISKKWNLKINPPFFLSYNYVAPVYLNNGKSAVLKIGYPKDREFKGEVAALKIYASIGAPKLIKEDTDESVILIEQVIPGKPLSSLKDDDEATKILANSMKTIRKPIPTKNNFISISQWTEELIDYHTNFSKNSQGTIPLEIVTKAKKLFAELISTSGEQFLLHGDLHHDNLLFSKERGWQAIDPKGIIAEPEYETAAMIRNPYDKVRNSQDMEKLFSHRIRILSSVLRFDPERIRKWCFAQTVLSAVWSRNNTDHLEFAVRVSQALDNL